MNRTNRSNFCFSSAQVKEIIRGKRSEVVREVVDGERRSALFGEDLTSEGDSGYNEETRYALSNEYWVPHIGRARYGKLKERVKNDIKTSRNEITDITTPTPKCGL